MAPLFNNPKFTLVAVESIPVFANSAPHPLAPREEKLVVELFATPAIVKVIVGSTVA